MKCTMFQFKIRLTLHLHLLILQINRLTFCRKSSKMNKKPQPWILKYCVTLQKRLRRGLMKRYTSLNIWKQVIVIIIETSHHIRRWPFSSLTKLTRISRSCIPRRAKTWSIRIIFKRSVHSLKTKRSSKITSETQSPLWRAWNSSLGSHKERLSQTSTWMNGINI